MIGGIDKNSIGDGLSNGIFFNDCDKHPLLEKKALIVDIPAVLQSVLEYSKQYKQELLLTIPMGKTWFKTFKKD